MKPRCNRVQAQDGTIFVSIDSNASIALGPAILIAVFSSICRENYVPPPKALLYIARLYRLCRLPLGPSLASPTSRKEWHATVVRTAHSARSTSSLHIYFP
nr:hypothetical protein CFP56_09488 [Quercus suber]